MATVTEPHSETGPGGRPRRRRGVGFWVGVLMLLTGLSMIGYVGWEMFGTTVVSKRAQAQIVEDLREEWTQPPIDGGQSLEPREVPRGEASAIIRIPKFGDDYAVPVLEGVDDAVLTKGYGHFPGSAGPGEVGNYALAAHRVTHGEPLRDLPKLRPGDRVIVETRDTTYTYELTTNPNDLVVDFTQVWVVDPLPDNPNGGVEPVQEKGQKLITLTTCSELFHTDNRMIAFGVLVETEAASPA